MRQIHISSYRPAGFAEKYQRLVADTVIPYQYDILRDAVPGAEESHAIKNFINAGRALRGEDTGDGFRGMVFQDSDAAKWLEAAAYSLAVFPSDELEREADAFIDVIAAAQDEDGYLDTRFTIKDREKRWTDLLEAHELYCMGHMMEAAAAYFEATGKRKLLDVMTKCALHIYRHFVEEGRDGYSGHPEVELALVRMYRATEERKLLELAKHFVDVRGREPYYFEREARERDWEVWGNDASDREYQQSHAPVREQQDAVGHAVRAMYLYSGMADVAAETGDAELSAACRRLWESVTQKRMYVTGGVGSTVHGEAFTVDYDLPSDTAYAETCASVGLIFFAMRMLEREHDGEYADVMERAFYNTVLAGMSLDGKRFFYVNPLECVPGISGAAATERHVLCERPGWFACACCPPNAARLIASLGKYAYGETHDTAFCNMFLAGEVEFANGVSLECSTGYPYGFEVRYDVRSGGRIAVRIPGWSRNKFTVELNGQEYVCEPEKGYVYIDAEDGDRITVTLDDAPRYVYASPKVPALSGKIAVERGPLVYCFEGADNGGDVLSLSLRRGGRLRAEKFDPNMLGGTAVISAEALRTADPGALYTSEEPERTPVTARAVPYYTWANRGVNQMRVWMPAE